MSNDPTIPDQDPTPDSGPTEAEQKAAEAEARSRALEADLRRSNEVLMKLASERFDNRPPQDDPVEDPIPDADEDPEGHLQATIRKAVAETVAPLGQAVQAYQAGDRKILFETRREMALRDLKERYGGLYDEYAKDVEKYLSSFPLEQQVAQGAAEEAFHRVYGAKAIEKSKEEFSRTQSALGSGGRGTTSGDLPEPRDVELKPDEARFASMHGLDAKSFQDMKGAGKYTIDDFKKLKEAASK